MSEAERQKRAAAAAALELVPRGEILGVGTGSTVNAFIELLGEGPAAEIPAAVSSSKATTARLQQIGIRVMELNEALEHGDELAVYVDGADEFDASLALLKGGGGALTGEKIVASASRELVCIVDAGKRVDVLGAFPLPVEVLPMARRAVARRLRALGGDPRLRDGLTDHGNPILDVHGLHITDPEALELEIETLPGVITCGLFARRPADVVLMGTGDGVERFDRRGTR